MKNLLKFKIASLFFLCITILSFAACNDDKDYYDPEYQTENPLEGIDVPTDFDWRTTSTINVSVIVNDEMDGEYHYLIEVFTQNPISEKQASPIAKGVSKEGLVYNNQITVPQNIESLYIRQTDPKKRSITRCFPVAEQITCDFRPQQSRTAPLATRTGTDPELFPYKEIPGDAIVIDLNNPGSYEKGGNFVLQEDFSGDFGIKLSGTLYIAPYVTLKLNSFFIGGDLTIIIMQGASIIIEDGELNLHGDLIIAPEAKCQLNRLVSESGSLIENWGYTEIDDLSLSKAQLVNHYSIRCKKADIGSKSIFTNNCSILVEDVFYCNQTDIHLNNGYIGANFIDLNSLNVYLSNGSMIESLSTGIHYGGQVHHYGEGATSLIKTPEITVQGTAKNITYDGSIAIECNKYPNLTIGSTVELFALGESITFIEVCTGIINPGNPGTDPGEEEFPIIQTSDATYTYLFEDNWPLYGDYDMNDIVFQISNITTYQNAENKVEKLKFNFTLQAIGAYKRLAGAVMLDNVSANAIQSVEYTNNAPILFQTSNGVETRQSKAVIPLFDEAHTAMGLPSSWFVNTVNDVNDNRDYLTYTVTVVFSSPVSTSDLNIQHFNAFIIADVNKLPSLSSDSRIEIHLRDYAPTAKANTSYFGNHNDNSNSVYYSSKDNLVWGLMIPDTYRWSKEGTDIQDVYPEFKNWITSGGADNNRWWDSPVEELLFKK